MFDTIREYHSLLRKANLKAAPDKTFFFLRKVKFLGHVVSKDGLSPIASRIDDMKKLKSPESKTEVLGVLGVMGFYSTYIINFHVDAKCLYELANSNDKFQWLPCHEEVFQKLKDKFCHDISNAISNVNYPFHIHADSSYSSKTFLKGKELFLPILESLIRPSRKCLLNIVNYVE